MKLLNKISDNLKNALRLESDMKWVAKLTESDQDKVFRIVAFVATQKGKDLKQILADVRHLADPERLIRNRATVEGEALNLKRELTAATREYEQLALFSQEYLDGLRDLTYKAEVEAERVRLEREQELRERDRKRQEEEDEDDDQPSLFDDVESEEPEVIITPPPFVPLALNPAPETPGDIQDAEFEEIESNEYQSVLDAIGEAVQEAIPEPAESKQIDFKSEKRKRTSKKSQLEESWGAITQDVPMA